jgi:hypothetical protein
VFRGPRPKACSFTYPPKFSVPLAHHCEPGNCR